MNPTPTPTPTSTDVTILGHGTGFQAFLVTFLLALACVAIGLLLARQLRRMNHNYRDKVDSGELPEETVRGTGRRITPPGGPRAGDGSGGSSGGPAGPADPADDDRR